MIFFGIRILTVNAERASKMTVQRGKGQKKPKLPCPTPNNTDKKKNSKFLCCCCCNYFLELTINIHNYEIVNPGHATERIYPSLKSQKIILTYVNSNFTFVFYSLFFVPFLNAILKYFLKTYFLFKFCFMIIFFII